MTAAVQLAQSVAPGVSLGFKNRIINGAMTIDQRGTASSAISLNANAVYCVDRFRSAQAGQTWGSGVFSAQQVVDAPAGFYNSLKLTVTTADASLAATDGYTIAQLIEYNNVTDLNWGTVNAKPMTLSFWAKASIAGTYSGAIQHNGATVYSNTFTYVLAANTWTYVSVPFTGQTNSNTPDTGVNTSIVVYFDLGSGSNLQTSTLNTWQSAQYTRTSSTVSLVSTLSATFNITGVQLEVGTTATPFEFRDYGRELILCQRYYQRLTANPSADLAFPAGLNPGTTSNFVTYFPCVTMRSAPTTSANTAAWGYCRNNGSFTIYATNAVPSVGSGATSSLVVFYATVASGLTSASLGLTYVLINNWIDFSSEL